MPRPLACRVALLVTTAIALALATGAAVAAARGRAPAPAGTPGASDASPPASPSQGSGPSEPAVVYQAPIEAPVVDGFRAPATRYGPGNRGIEYVTPAGAAVRAAADGTVTFAGPVAGSLDVTVRHADGVRTSYVGLASIRVRAGETVRRGDLVGTTTERVHVGARRGEDYIDPASLWETGVEGAVLVPLDGGRHAP
jgi:murein DD-endopeptidase MepM/ murein hydrolase activator NlpD